MLPKQMFIPTYRRDPNFGIGLGIMPDSYEPVAVRVRQETSGHIAQRLGGAASEAGGGRQNVPAHALGQGLDTVYLERNNHA